MNVLSLLQPWASLVVMGVKTIETRSWSTPYRGDLLIHASLGKRADFLTNNPPYSNYITNFKQLPFGAIIGQVVLTSILRVEDFGLPDDAMNALTMEEKAFGDYTAGRFGWVLENAVQFNEPVFTRGHLRLWEYAW